MLHDILLQHDNTCHWSHFTPKKSSWHFFVSNGYNSVHLLLPAHVRCIHLTDDVRMLDKISHSRSALKPNFPQLLAVEVCDWSMFELSTLSDARIVTPTILHVIFLLQQLIPLWPVIPQSSTTFKFGQWPLNECLHNQCNTKERSTPRTYFQLADVAGHFADTRNWDVTAAN